MKTPRAAAGKQHAVILALNLLPFAGIAFLWFIGVVRDRIGQGEDRLFAIRLPTTGCVLDNALVPWIDRLDHVVVPGGS
jgi:hypothetical protein